MSEMCFRSESDYAEGLTPFLVDCMVHDSQGDERLNNFKKVMHDYCQGSSLDFLKSLLGGKGTILIKQQGLPVDPELREIFQTVKTIVEE